MLGGVADASADQEMPGRDGVCARGGRDQRSGLVFRHAAAGSAGTVHSHGFGRGPEGSAFFWGFLVSRCGTRRNGLERLARNCSVLTGACEERMVETAPTVDQAGPWAVAYGNGDAGDHNLTALEVYNLNPDFVASS